VIYRTSQNGGRGTLSEVRELQHHIEELYILEYILQCVESQLTFRRNNSTPNSWPKKKPSKNLATEELFATFHAGLMLGLFLDPEEVVKMLLRNVR
jgi:hypothetical protein